MYKFTIEYYFERYHTGYTDTNKIRTGSVFANDAAEALDKIRKVDSDFVSFANMSFEEVVEKG